MACLFKANKVTVKLTICKLGGLGTEKDLGFNASSLVEAESRTALLWWNWSWQMDGWLVPPHHTMVSHHWCGITPYYGVVAPHHTIVSHHTIVAGCLTAVRESASLHPLCQPATQLPCDLCFHPISTVAHVSSTVNHLIFILSVRPVFYIVPNFWIQILFNCTSLYSVCIHIVLCCECGE